MKKLNITTVEQRRIRGDLIQYYKIKNGYDKISLIKPPRENFGSRPHNQKIERENHKIDSLRHSFLTNRIATNWNNLPKKVVESISVNAF